MKEALQKLGLTDKESAAYLTLVESGQSSISNITKYAKMHRPDVYQAVEGLLARGLITKIVKGKRAQFVAEPPERLGVLIEELRAQFTDLIPQLKSIYYSGEQKPIVKFLEGKKGVSSIFEDLVTSLKRGDVFYRYSSAKDTRKADSYLPANYREIRDQKQLERFVITSETQSKTKKPRLERATKVVSKEFGLFDYDVTQVIYGNKVALIDYNSETALLIENPSMAEFQKKLFQILYRKL